ncbi:DUF2325 domain-containing protein [Shewanella eurypsychrophilus]|uniref:DUF2325 domain-containing protein n=1 Tax=Shewanella eurypsychrophilus TaxID=2593656 RepID=A0ABX6VBT9_9GAMM|nr:MULTISPECIES: DUF2325 domain-containing protein [Shewanella]QFU24168.1 DUF2325 domain-containing protein [Shewanella sp. YLB-09]QPG59374.1 DUF2325 domain-containing protein [Shewanella eurypsychrophilus]
MCDTPATGTQVFNRFKGKRKLWELSTKLLCPVIGTCLTTSEIRKLAEKIADKEQARKSDYWLHTWIVSNCDDKHHLSLTVQKHLDKKFAAAIKRFGQIKCRDELNHAWQQHIDRGASAEALWALLTHPLCDLTIQEMAYETIHMLSHQIGAGQRADLKRLHTVEKELLELKRALDKSQQKAHQTISSKERQLSEQQQLLAEIKAENQHLKEHCKRLEREGDNNAAASQLQQLHNELASKNISLEILDKQKLQWQQKLQNSEDNILGLTQKLQQQQQETRALEGFVKQSLPPCNGCSAASCIDCPDLKGLKILCVGGQQRMTEQYRELVSRCNGEFSHHDGGVEDRSKRLDAMLWSADAVICASDCISHDAYYRLKRFCKQHNKRHLFIPSSGISSFAKAMDDVANDISCAASAYNISNSL